MFTGIYIAAVGWGYYVAYGATLAMFLLLMAMKDVIDIFMVSMPHVCHLLGPTLCTELFAVGERLPNRGWGKGGGGESKGGVLEDCAP